MDDRFERGHPWPDKCHVDRLFKFTRLDDAAPDRLKQVLVEGRLYHALPQQFNDPWDCRPAVQLPADGQGLARVRSHIVRFLRRTMSRRAAERKATETLANREQMHAELQAALEQTYGNI